MGIEVSELGQECASNSGASFKNKEERTVRIHGALCVYWACYLFVNITDLMELCHWLKKKELKMELKMYLNKCRVV